MTAVRRLYSGRLLLHIAKIESRYNDLTLNGEMIKNSVNGKQQRSIYVFTCRLLFITVYSCQFH